MPRETDFFEFAHANRTLFLLTLAVGFFVYGYEITNFSLSIDEEWALLDGVSANYIRQGRWGIALLKHTLFPEGLIPFFSAAVSVIFLSCAAILLQHIFRLEGYSRYLFCLLFIAFPQFAYQMEFLMQADCVAFGMLTSVFSYMLFKRFAAEKKTGYFLAALCVYAFSISCYQSILFLPCVVYLLDCLRSELAGAPLLRKTWWKAAAFVLLSAMLYSLSSSIVLAVGGLSPSQYTLQLMKWGTEPLTRCLLKILTHYPAHFAGIYYYGEQIFVTVLIPIVGIALHAFKHLKGAGRLMALLLLGACCLVPFSQILLLGWGQPPRVFLAQGLLFAGIWTMLPAQGAKARALLGALTVYCIFFASAHVSQLFFMDTLRWESDKLLAHRLVSRVHDVAKPVPAVQPKVFIEGSYFEEIPKASPRTDIFGHSFFEWGSGSSIMYKFMAANGIARFTPVGASELSSQQRQTLREMPVWPDPRSVRLCEGVVLVKLSE